MKKYLLLLKICLLVMCLFFCSFVVYAAGVNDDNIPKKINLQGRYTRNYGDPITNTSITVKYQFLDSKGWGDVKSMTTTTDDEGLYNLNLTVNLSSTTSSFRVGINSDPQGDGYPLASSPYAFYASTATYALSLDPVNGDKLKDGNFYGYVGDNPHKYTIKVDSSVYAEESNSISVTTETTKTVVWGNDNGTQKWIDVAKDIKVDTAAWAVDAGTSTWAVKSGTSTWAVDAGTSTWTVKSGTSTWAVNAGTSTWTVNAGTSTWAVKSGTSTWTVNAGTSTWAVKSGTSTWAVDAGTSTWTVKSGTSTWAVDAGTSTYATNAGTATYAVNAGTSTWADAANTAVNAQTIDSEETTTTYSYGASDNSTKIKVWAKGKNDKQGWYEITKEFYSSGLKGADLAEIYQSTEKLVPGDVVSIDTTKDNAVVKTKVSEDTLVAGVISTEPGVLMNQNEKGYKLALVGKVPTKVCNEGGAIKRGDLLVSASIPGYAKKAGDNPKAGTVIGKALENLDSQKGTILVLVNLQ